jgi:hypothetical protein
MAKNNKEDWVDRFTTKMERFAECMSDWAEELSEKMETKASKNSNVSVQSSRQATIIQNGTKIVVDTSGKKTVVKVNDKEVYRSDK